MAHNSGFHRAISSLEGRVNIRNTAIKAVFVGFFIGYMLLTFTASALDFSIENASYSFEDRPFNITYSITTNFTTDILCVERNDTIFTECFDLNGSTAGTITVSQQDVNGLYEYNVTANDSNSDLNYTDFSMTFFDSATQDIENCTALVNIPILGNYEITKNIDCNYTDLDSGISAYNDGTFNGNGFKISNLTLTCDNPEANRCALINNFGSNEVAGNTVNPYLNSLKIENVKVTGSGTTDSCSGFIGNAFSGLVNNVTVKNVTVSACDDFVGGFASTITGSNTVTNVYVENIKLTGASASNRYGGFIGRNFASATYVANVTVKDVNIITGQGASGLIAQTTSEGRMLNVGVENFTIISNGSANSHIGGLSAFYRGQIEQCYARNGTVLHTGTDNGVYVSGLIGNLDDGTTLSGLINNCYVNDVFVNITTVGITGTTGGIVSHSQLGENTLIENTYAVATVGGDDIDVAVACFAGNSANSSSVQASFFNNDTCLDVTYVDFPNLTNSNTFFMIQQSTYTNVGWDFTDIWSMVLYPELQAEPFASELPDIPDIPPVPPTQDINLTVFSPENITYNVTLIALEISANDTINSSWYFLNGGSKTLFTPNTTITGVNGSNSINIFVNNSDSNEDNEIVYFTITVTPPSPAITGSFIGCYNDYTLIERTVRNITINGIINETIETELITCSDGCSNFTLLNFGNAGCVENEYILSILTIIFAIIAVLIVRGVFK